MAKLLILGAGGHGKVVAEVARAAGHEIMGFADSENSKCGALAEPGGARVLLSERELLDLIAGGDRLPFDGDAVAVAVGDNRTRLRLLALVHPNVCPPVVHPSATVSASARLGRGTIVFPRAVINASAVIGDGVIVNTGAIVEHDCIVGDGVHLSPASTLCGNVRVGACAWIGAGAVVIPGVCIGADATVGAGAAVARDVAPSTTVIGVPARPRPRA